MKKCIVLILMTSVINCQAQLRSPKATHKILSFFRMRGSAPDMRMVRNAPSLAMIPYTDFSYWQGAAYISYSENGRIRTTHHFDATGMLRETQASISLRRQGRLSQWRIQFSPQRTRPLLIYTIR